MTAMRSRRFLAYALFAALLLGACGGQDDVKGASAEQPSAETTTAPTTDAEPTEAATTEAPAGDGGGKKHVPAKIIDTDFRPVTLTVKVGSTVDWRQVGDQPHSVSAVDGSFDSSPDCGPLESDKCLGEGDTFSFSFEKAGEFEYYCRVHGLPDGTGMFGTVVVK